MHQYLNYFVWKMHKIAGNILRSNYDENCCWERKVKDASNFMISSYFYVFWNKNVAIAGCITAIMHLKLGILFHSWNLKFGLIHKLWKHFIFPISLQNSILMFLWRVPLSPPALSIRICKRLPNRKWHNLSTLTWNKDRRI